MVFGALVPWRSAHAAEAADRVSRRFALPAGRALRLEATIAELTIVGSNRPDVEIEIVRRAPAAADLLKFPLVVDDGPEALRIAATQLADGRDPNLKSEIVVRAPASAIFQAVRVFEGRVKITGLTGACDVDIRRGPVEATSLGGRMRLESGIGGVTLTDATLTAGGMMRVRVFNGPARVRLAAAPVNARILAVTFNGAITSEIPLTMKDQFGPRFGEATIGAGEPVLSIDVVTGDIAIGVKK
jgi:hypothetical protein